ncbi:MAG: hypothetical protein WBQ09_08675 [Terriglobales bacterium]|jgi:hypothetical protein
MKTSVRLGISLLIMALMASAFITRATVSAKTSHPASALGLGRGPSAPPTLVFNRKLLSTSFSMSGSPFSVSSGAQAIDSPLKFSCPTGGCTATADLEVLAGDSTVNPNEWGVCAQVDGSYMPPTKGCYYLGTLPADGTWTAASFTFVQSGITAGTHTIEGFVYTQQGAAVASYTITYRLYTP